MKSFEDSYFHDDMAKITKVYVAFTSEYLKEYNLTRSEVPYLMTLFEKDIVSQEFFSNLYDFNESTVTRTLTGIEKKGYIRREKNPNDKRMKMVSLTDKGRDVCLKLIEYKNEFHRNVFNNFSDDEFEELVRLLRKLFDNVYKTIDDYKD